MIPSEQLQNFLAFVNNEPLRTSLSELCELQGWGKLPKASSMAMMSDFIESNYLSIPSVSSMNEVTAKFSISIKPGTAQKSPPMDFSSFKESQTIELKSSLFYNHAHPDANNNPGFRDANPIPNTSLKTIAGFMNKYGGKLYVGVDDNGKVLGIEFDYGFLKPGSQNSDGWELRLLELLEKKLHNGKLLSNLVETRFINSNDLLVAEIIVQRSDSLVFLFDEKKSHTIYVRQGNRTIPYPCEQVEELILQRRALK